MSTLNSRLFSRDDLAASTAAGSLGTRDFNNNNLELVAKGVSSRVGALETVVDCWMMSPHDSLSVLCCGDLEHVLTITFVT